MNLFIEWQPEIALTPASWDSAMYEIDLDLVSRKSGVYFFGRKYGSKIEALYVGRANRLRSRLRSQLNSVPLMLHITNAKSGKRVVMTAEFQARPRQTASASLPLIERALIRHFLAEGHDLVNKQGRRIAGHEIMSYGHIRDTGLPERMFLQK